MFFGYFLLLLLFNLYFLTFIPHWSAVGEEQWVREGEIHWMAVGEGLCRMVRLGKETDLWKDVGLAIDAPKDGHLLDVGAGSISKPDHSFIDILNISLGPQFPGNPVVIVEDPSEVTEGCRVKGVTKTTVKNSEVIVIVHQVELAGMVVGQVVVGDSP